MASLGINGWDLIIQLVAFVIFVVLLWRFALGPIVRVIDERQTRIRDSMEAATRMQAEMQATAARNEELLAQARVEGQQIVASAREVGEATIARAREEAGKQADTYLVRAQEALRQETETARQQLRQEVADLAVLAAGRIIRKELDPAAQARLVEETLAEAAQGPRPNGARPGGAPA